MARLNVAARNQNRTFEGALALPTQSAEKLLRRAVMSCLLWEDQFYEDGVAIADRIRTLVPMVQPLSRVSEIAIEAREIMNLRHVPLLLTAELSRYSRGSSLVSDTVARVVQRADELAELLAIYTQGGDRRQAPEGNGRKIAAQVRKGLARALVKFDEYQLAKYERGDSKVKLRDLLRIVRPKPEGDAQAALWKRALTQELTVPDTWEIALTRGADKKETFTRLLTERKLGYFALLRNLRNMVESGVDEQLVRDAIVARKGGAERVLPFRYIAAARAAPRFERELDQALCASIDESKAWNGKTVVLVDVSGSMDAPLSGRSDLRRVDAAAALASVIPGAVQTFTFSNRVVEVPPRKGMAGVDAIMRSQDHGGTYLGGAVAQMNKVGGTRLIVISDEQSHDPVGAPVGYDKAYMINVASYQNGVGYGEWTRIDGFSEGVLKYIAASEEG